MSTKDTKDTKWILKYLLRGYEFAAIHKKWSFLKALFVLLVPFVDYKKMDI